MTTLPSGTRIRLPNEDAARNFQCWFMDALQICKDDLKQMEVVAPLKICTSAYIAERDEQELALLREIERLSLVNSQSNK